MIAQLFAFSYISFCSFSVGAKLKKILNLQIDSYIIFLLGFTFCNAILTLISIFYPVNYRISIFLFVLSAILLLSDLKWILKYFTFEVKTIIDALKYNYIFGIVVIVFIIINFFQSLYQPSLHYDAGLYHIQAIKWIEEYPTVYGVANVNVLLGYNFNIFTWFAASSFQTLFVQPIYSINFTLTCYFSIWISSKIAIELKSKNYLVASSLLLIFYSLIFNFLPHISTTSNNTSVFILIVTIFISIIYVKTTKDLQFLITIFSIYAVTIKLSALPVLIITVYLFLKNFNNKNKAIYPPLIIGTLFILIPWIVKTVIMTGWLLFPFPQLDLFPVSWKVPKTVVIELKEIIKQFAQSGLENPENGWVTIWFKHQAISDLILIFLSPLILFVYLYVVIRKKNSQSKNEKLGVFVAVLGIIFMFYNAPSLIYGIAFIISLLTIIVNVINRESRTGKYTFYIIFVLLFTIFLKDNWYHPWHFVKNAKDRFLVPYPILASNKKAFTYFLVDNKVKCYYPIGSNQCFDQLIPCAMSNTEGLHMRGKSIGEGFYVNQVKSKDN